jgi:hypothetical protein
MDIAHHLVRGARKAEPLRVAEIAEPILKKLASSPATLRLLKMYS